MGKKQDLQPEEKMSIDRLYGSGLSFRAIAREVGSSHQVVASYLKLGTDYGQRTY